MRFANILKNTFTNSSANSNHHASLLTFVKSRKAMVKELVIAQRNGSLVGVYSGALGDGMFLVGINNVEKDYKSEIITFETYDQTGALLPRPQLAIEEIKMMCVFNKKYVNPILNKLEFV